MIITITKHFRAAVKKDSRWENINKHHSAPMRVLAIYSVHT